MSTTYVKLDSYEVGVGGIAAITFSNISQAYTDLIIKFSGQNPSSSNQYISFNGNTTLTSGWSSGLFSAGGTTTGTFTNAGYAHVYGLENAAGTSGLNGYFSTAEYRFVNYAKNNNYKAMTVKDAQTGTVANTYMYMLNNQWANLAPITSITMTAGAGVHAQYTTATLYGVFNQDVSAVPSAPTIGTATLGNLSASVAFTGVSGAASYLVTSSPSGITATGTESPIRIRGLTAGTSYTFTVTAVNPYGNSTASAASNAVVPTTPGVTWTNQTGAMPAASGWTYARYSNGVFFAGIYDVLNKIALSPNGITWTSRSLLTTGSGYYTGQAYGLGIWVLCARNGAGTGYTIQWSDNNGSSWNYPSGSVPNYSMYSLGFNGSAFAAPGNATSGGMYSTTGYSGWTNFTLPSNQGWVTAIGGNGYFVAIQDGGSGPTTAAASSSNNGATWTARTMTSTAQRWQDGVYEPVSAKWVFVSRTGGACYSTDNGASYTASTLPTGTYTKITYGDGYYIVAGWGNICTSPDGITWTLRTGPSGTSGGGEGIAYGPNGALVVQYGTTNMGTAF